MSAGVQPRQGVVISNWAEVHSARPTQYFEPTSPQEVATIVSKCKLEGQVVRVVGAGHSPNDCAMSSDVMISLKRLNRVLVVDVERNAVKIEAGITLRQLNEILDLNGLAMPNLGSISDQSVAGAIATGTHGTGAGLGSLSSNVLELQLVDGCGQLVTASALESSGALYWFGEAAL
jgi:L-gulonolactone oxidase